MRDARASQPRTSRLSLGSAEKEMRLRLLSLRSLGRLLVPGGRVGRADHLGCHGTRYVRYGTPEAGARTQYVQCVMPGGQAALRLRYMSVANAGGWYA